MTEELEVLRIVTGRLDSARVPYMVTGSIAASYYAMPRMTRDIDLVVEAEAADADRLCALFEDDFYVDRDAAREAIAARGAFNLIDHAHVIKVDLIVRKDSDYRRTEFARRQRAVVDDHAFFLVTPEDLIIWKTSGRVSLIPRPLDRGSSPSRSVQRARYGRSRSGTDATRLRTSASWTSERVSRAQSRTRHSTGQCCSPDCAGSA